MSRHHRPPLRGLLGVAVLVVAAIVLPTAVDGSGGVGASPTVPTVAPTAEPATAEAAATTEPEAYRLLLADGSVQTFGEAAFSAAVPAPASTSAPVALTAGVSGGGGIAATPDGTVFTYGDAGFHGALGALPLNDPIVAAAQNADGSGYLLVASDGGVFTFGDLGFFGSAGAIPLNRPIVGAALTPSGEGYWLVASDGGVFTYGDAAFFGSTGGIQLNSPIVGIASTPSGEGYWLVARDGGVFTFGDAVFHGSTGDVALNAPIIGLSSTTTGDGYWLAGADGGVFTFGDAPFLGAATGSAVVAIAAVPNRYVDLQILGFNDFHGNLEPPTGSNGMLGGIPAGGAEYLSTHLAKLRDGRPFSVTVHAGDAIGATPLVSGLFADEPAIEALGAAGVDIASVGNHEFDRGKENLLRIQEGGCLTGQPNVSSCAGGPFEGATFEYLAANVTVDATGETLFPSVAIEHAGGVPVAFIGMTLEGTPQIVTPAGVAGLSFSDEAETVNALVPELVDAGIETIVVVVHEGGPAGSNFNACPTDTGAIGTISAALDDAVDVVVSGHTHQPYNCTIDGKLVTSASSFGRAISDIELSLDRLTNDVAAKAAENVIVTRDVPKDPVETAIVQKYVTLAAPLANRVVGLVPGPVSRTQDASGESPLGNLIADSQLAATQTPSQGAVIALMNPGGVRADLAAAPDGSVTYTSMFTVQPFGNSLVTMTLTGDQLRRTLEQQQFALNSSGAPTRVLYASAGFHFTFQASAPAGSRISAMTLNGTPIDPAASYRVTVNSFLATGGDGFTVLNEGTDRVGGDVDIDALASYFAANGSPPAVLTPPTEDRITSIP